MATRTIKHCMTFNKPFALAGFDELLPAGQYDVEIDEELLEGPSFPVWRRQMAYLSLPASPQRPGVTRTLTVNPNDLDAALDRDRSN